MDNFGVYFFLFVFNLLPILTILGILIALGYLFFDIMFYLQILIFNSISNLFRLKMKRLKSDGSYFLNFINEDKDSIWYLLLGPFISILFFYLLKFIFVILFNIESAKNAFQKSIEFYQKIISEKSITFLVNFIGFGFLLFLFGGLIVAFFMERSSKNSNL